MLPRIHPTSNASTTTPVSLSTVRQDRSHALVRAVGEWDLANAHVLREQLEEHEKAGRRFIRLDVSAVSFLDCTCLDVLVRAHRRLLAARGAVVLIGVTPRLMRLLRLARLDQVLLTTSRSDLDARSDRGPIGEQASEMQPIGLSA
jgi:anti-sigma B factor antagonist